MEIVQRLKFGQIHLIQFYYLENEENPGRAIIVVKYHACKALGVKCVLQFVGNTCTQQCLSNVQLPP